jgi:hypothetical protein
MKTARLKARLFFEQLRISIARGANGSAPTIDRSPNAKLSSNNVI